MHANVGGDMEDVVAAVCTAVIIAGLCWWIQRLIVWGILEGHGVWESREC